jgi:hypothetical protein
MKQSFEPASESSASKTVFSHEPEAKHPGHGAKADTVCEEVMIQT